MLSKVKYKFVLLTFGMVCVLALISSCSSTKFITEDNCLLKSCAINCEDQSFNTKSLESYYAQRPNSKWFSLMKLPLGIYNMLEKPCKGTKKTINITTIARSFTQR